VELITFVGFRLKPYAC